MKENLDRLRVFSNSYFLQVNDSKKLRGDQHEYMVSQCSRWASPEIYDRLKKDYELYNEFLKVREDITNLLRPEDRNEANSLYIRLVSWYDYEDKKANELRIIRKYGYKHVDKDYRNKISDYASNLAICRRLKEKYKRKKIWENLQLGPEINFL